ncbi:MAG: GYD domain-containing protein [Rhizomicrobium sp.]
MAIFVMLTRLNTEAVKEPKRLERLERDVMDRIRKDCPDVEWLGSYAVLGPCDYLDIFNAKDIESAMRVSTLVRTFGHAQTEVWAATEWDRFKEIVHTLAAAG